MRHQSTQLLALIHTSLGINTLDSGNQRPPQEGHVYSAMTHWGHALRQEGNVFPMVEDHKRYMALLTEGASTSIFNV